MNEPIEASKRYRAVTLIFTVVALTYVWLMIDAILSLRSSQTTTSVFYYMGLSRIAGALSVFVLACQVVFIRKDRPGGLWKVLGYVNCAVCLVAILNTITNFQ